MTRLIVLGLDVSLGVAGQEGLTHVKCTSNVFEGLSLKEASQKFDYTLVSKMAINEVGNLLNQLQSRVVNSYRGDPEAFAKSDDESFGRSMFLRVCLYAEDPEVKKYANAAYKSFCNFKSAEAEPTPI